MFYTERKNNNNTNLNNERKKGYDTVVSMMKSKMKLYGIVSPVKIKRVIINIFNSKNIFHMTYKT